MCMCRTCGSISGMMLLVLGFLYLLVDLGVWDFWGVSWWTAILLILGLSLVASGKCHECRVVREGRPPSKKK